MKVGKKWLILAVIFMVVNMITATQYAVTKVGYEYNIVHPSNANIRFIGSDNSSDGMRILRVIDSNESDIGVKLVLGGNFTTNQVKFYTAAFGIVNEENFTINITHINVSSANATYLKIWLHGDRDKNANSTDSDPTSVLMWNNNTVVNESTTTAWTLAPGNNNANNMCYNVSDSAASTIDTDWDERAHVRYSTNDTNATTAISDFVWVQISIDVPEVVDGIGAHTGTIWIHFESDSLD